MAGPLPSKAAIERVTGIITAWMMSRALHVAAELGIADQLASGPKTANELAAATSAHSRSLYRLLRMLASEGIFAETADGKFELTETGAVLQSGFLRDYVRLIGDPQWSAFGELLHSIKTGQPSFEYVHGVSFFDYLSAHPEEQERFDRGLANALNADNPLIAAAYDFSRYGRIVDVGGGRGGFLAEVLMAHNGPRGVLFDQAQVVAKPDYLARAGLLDRCEVVGGSFFESVPPGCDLYILKHVIHDWPDDVCAGILRRCRDAVAKDGRIVVIDSVVNPGNTPQFSKTVDLLMLVSLDGQERTEEEFARLFSRAGLKLTRVVPTPTTYSVVEAMPV